jgi:universal stress protein A
MHAQKILFPTDFSEASRAALAHATNLAADWGAKLLILHVDEPPIVFGESFATPPDMSGQLRRELEAVVPHDPSVAHEHRLRLGAPANEIVGLAAAENVDLIVLGTHGRTGLRRLLMGSVAEEVVRRAPCTVYTVREPREELAGHGA